MDPQHLIKMVTPLEEITWVDVRRLKLIAAFGLLWIISDHLQYLLSISIHLSREAIPCSTSSPAVIWLAVYRWLQFAGVKDDFS